MQAHRADHLVTLTGKWIERALRYTMAYGRGGFRRGFRCNAPGIFCATPRAVTGVSALSSSRQEKESV